MLKMFLLVLLVLTANLVDPVKPVAQDRARVGWAAMTASHTPLWVAQEKGFLAKQGLKNLGKKVNLRPEHSACKFIPWR